LPVATSLSQRQQHCPAPKYKAQIDEQNTQKEPAGMETNERGFAEGAGAARQPGSRAGIFSVPWCWKIRAAACWNEVDDPMVRQTKKLRHWSFDGVAQQS
jgi:hypothetical protein